MKTPGFLTCPIAACPEDLRRLAYADPSAFPVLFDSAATGPLGRYTMLAAYPDAALWQDGRGGLHSWGLRDAWRPDQGFLSALEELWRAARTHGVPREAARTSHLEALSGPFHGGWIVYLGYELASEIEPQLALPAVLSSGQVPAAFALRVPAALVYDHTADRAFTLVETGREALQHRLTRDLAAAGPILSVPITTRSEPTSVIK